MKKGFIALGLLVALCFSCGCVGGKQVRVTIGATSLPSIELVDAPVEEYDSTATVDPSLGLPNPLPTVESEE